MKTEFYVSFTIKKLVKGPDKGTIAMRPKGVHMSHPSLRYRDVALKFCVQVPDEYLERSIPTISLKIRDKQLIAPKIEACVMDALLDEAEKE